jgi:hypothetical protein
MSYIGKKPTSSFASATSQTFTGNNSTTAFTLNRRVSAPEDLEVFVSNIQQQPTTSYTIGSTGLALNFDSAPPSGEFYVVYRSEAGTSAIDVGAARTANANTFSAAQTFSGDLTVDTTTLKINSTNNNVGIGVSNAESAVKLEVNAGSDGAVAFSARSDGGNGNNRRFNLIPFADGGGANYGGGLKIQTRDSVNVFHDRMQVKSNGQIFIGNTSGTLPSTTMGVNSAGRHIIANNGAGYLLLQDNSTAAVNNGFDIHMGGVPAGTATLFSGGSIGGFVENGTNADGYLKFSTSLDGTITEAMRINSDGAVTKVKQPSISVDGDQNSGAAIETPSNVTYHTITEYSTSPANFYSQGITYNNINGRFTVPEDGKYLIGVSVYTYSNNKFMRVRVEVNDVRRTSFTNDFRTSDGDLGQDVSISGTCLLSLSGGDYITFRLYVGNTSGVKYGRWEEHHNVFIHLLS